jgi:hypothetical protein
VRARARIRCSDAARTCLNAHCRHGTYTLLRVHIAGAADVDYYFYYIFCTPLYVPYKKNSLETGALNVKGPTRDEEILDRAPLSVAEICFNLIFIKDVKFIITR